MSTIAAAPKHPGAIIGLPADRHVDIPSAVTINQPDSRQELAKALIATGIEDRAAFRQLYALTSARLFGVCLRICGERQAAEDVLQEVYAIIWRRAGAYQPGEASPFAWLATIARNRAIDYRRAMGRRPATSLDEVAEPAASGRLALEGLLLDEEERKLHGCLDRLSDTQRDAIRTAFFEGITYAGLADLREVPTSTIKSRIRRGLERLKECLDNDA
ncbi:sigma-70 family RNA polymerase sigma factor [Sphingomonas sp. CFBP8993]|uniref:sigma-70 family RNA polymerase sigma factor n=1 Tax=Sphingomonas sp. CFBP8993 TaxID=3096526 RepID=UPI002A6A6986|nr:sigma-70 family RNA polymerase sigma factor [Sphingomonas sp. CFBP8993]MDY0958660.1 sigma-70 family RNA polymerase sigma factor [Sphingomonas sp. CFBP8993]